MSKTAGSLPASLGIGLLLGLLCCAVGFFVIGMGHGWDLPFKYGVMSILLYPVAMARWRATGEATPWASGIVVTTAIAGVTLLLSAMLDVVPPPTSTAVKWIVLVGLPALYLVAAFVFGRAGKALAFGDVVLVLLGLGLDLAALFDAMTSPYASRSWPLQLPWLVLWAGWQVIAVLALIRHLRGQAIDASPPL